MNLKCKIEEGDRVMVSFHSTTPTLWMLATVLYVPGSVGDSWIFQDENTGQIHHVSEGCTVSTLQKPLT